MPTELANKSIQLAWNEKIYLASIQPHTHTDQASFTSLELIINIFMLPFISSIGFLLNLLCAVVYWQIMRKNNKVMYRYLFISSVVNSLAMLVDALATMPLCGQYCSVSQTYFAQAFYLYGFIYLADVLETFNFMIDIVITIDRYIEVSRRPHFFKKRAYKWIMTTLLCIGCFLFYIPFVLKKKIEFVSAEKGYTLVTSEFGKNKFWVYFILVQLLVSELIILCLMITVNWLLVFSLRNTIYSEEREIEKEESIQKMNVTEQENEICAQVIEEHRAEYYRTKNEYRLTIMIISMSLLTFLANSPMVVIHTIELLLYKFNPVLINKLNSVSNILIVISCTMYIFLFYYLNNVFRFTLNNMKNKIFNKL